MFRLDPKQAVIAHVSAGKAPERKSKLGALALELAAKPVEPVYSAAVIAGVAQALEAMLLIVVGLTLHATLGGDPLVHVLTCFGGVALAEAFLGYLRVHRIASYRSLFEQIWRSMLGWSISIVLVYGATTVLDPAGVLNRGWILQWWAGGSLVLAAYRLALGALVRRWTREGRLRRRTVIVGGGKDAEALIASIQHGAPDDIELVGLFDDRNDDRSPESVASLPKLGRVADLVEFARLTRIDLVIVSMPLSAEKRVLGMLRDLWVLPVDIRLSAHMSQLRFTSKAYSYVGEVPVFDMADRPISDWNLVFKWLFDKVVAIAALIVLSPVMIATAVAIKLDSKGPVLFVQKRHGFNNQFVNVYKFRSMYTDQADLAAAKQVTRDDPRVTRVGRFIRKTSIDELPQLFNVLKGDLSIVGPRPHAIAAKSENLLYYEAVEGYFARHRVKPGITGWAQINGWRGETDTVEKIMQRVNCDLYYIENWSLWLDLKIVLLTPASLLAHRENAF